jgi:alginate O-acetyltransferase complex protein AlgI
MLFNSLSFCVFFIVVTLLYFLLPFRWRWKMLLVASCIFYMAFIPAYIFILFTTILIDYWMGIKIAESEGKTRRTYLLISIVATCLVLFIFKYFTFFSLTVRELEALLGSAQTFPIEHILLPIGLSFHTFQSLSYVIEVYRGKQEPERNFGIYALYVMFYPQLVAGPIERPQNLLHQFYENHRFNVDDFAAGMRLIAWGYFQKMIIADRAAIYVNAVYGQWQIASGLSLIIATLLFAVQIYADFAGYSHIAIGCARVMGFRLMRNFNHPYFAGSLRDFWRRWHISLSTWFKDYVYIPLGGNRTSKARHYFNLLVTFTISGLWHGANWTFVIWGAFHGAMLSIESECESGMSRFLNNRFAVFIRRVVTIAAVCVGWVFFRAPSLGSAVAILRKMIVDTHLTTNTIENAIIPFSGDNSAFAFGATATLFILLMFALELIGEFNLDNLPARIFSSPYYEALAVSAIFQAVMFFGIMNSSAFIYFQF